MFNKWFTKLNLRLLVRFPNAVIWISKVTNLDFSWKNLKSLIRNPKINTSKSKLIIGVKARDNCKYILLRRMKYADKSITCKRVICEISPYYHTKLEFFDIYFFLGLWSFMISSSFSKGFRKLVVLKFVKKLSPSILNMLYFF